MAATVHPRQPKHADPDSVSLFETVDWSCCCCSRRAGILVLGACFLGLSLAVLVLCAAEASALRASLGPAATSPPPLLLPPPAGPPAKPTPPAQPRLQPHPLAPRLFVVTQEAEDHALRKGLLGLLTAQAVVAAAGALGALALLWGAWARRPNALLPWMVCAAAEVALLVSSALYCICTSMSRKLPVLGLDGFFALVVMFLFCVPVIYCLLAVGTYYRELSGTKYSEFKISAGVEGQPNGIVPSPLPTPGPSAPQPRPSVPPPKRPAPRPPLQRLNSEGHENPAFQSTAF